MELTCLLDLRLVSHKQLDNMKSNFDSLIKINNQLFEVANSAEQLFVNRQYDYVPTALRVFAEGIIKEVVGSSVLGNDLRSLIEQLTYDYPHRSMVAAAADDLRKAGNKTCHFVPAKFDDKQLIKLFQSAIQIQNFYLKEYQGSLLPLKKFDLKNLPETTVVTLPEVHALNIQKQQINDDNLRSKIEGYESKIIDLEKKKGTYLQELSTTQKLFEKQNSQIEQSHLEIGRLNQKIASLSEKSEIKAFKENVLALEGKIEELHNTNKQLEIDTAFFERQLNKNINEQSEQVPNKEILLKELKEFNISSTKEASLVELDDAQKKLIEIDKGKHFVIAPPGAGKTSILTQRLGSQISHYKDDEVISLTFTTKAAKEMQVRAVKVLEGRAPFIGNIHRLCIDVLRNNHRIPPQERFASILPDLYRDRLFDKALKETKLNIKSAIGSEIPQKLLIIVAQYAAEFGDGLKHEDNTRFDKYSFYKVYPYLKLVEANQFEGDNFVINQLKQDLHKVLIACHKSFLGAHEAVDLTLGVKVLWQIYLNFNDFKQQFKSIDYDDVLCHGLIELMINPQIKKFIQVDEVQDLNPVQWAIIRALIDDESHLFVVGDKEQAIYGFLGADLDGLDSSTSSYQKHYLTNNYRSNQGIISLLNLFREKAWNLPSITAKKTELDNASTMLLGYSDANDELYGTGKAVKKILEDKSRSVGLLLPTNKGVDTFCEYLATKGVNFFKVSSNDLMQLPIVQDWLSLIKAHKGNAQNIDWTNLLYRLTHQDFPNLDKVMDLVNGLSGLGVSLGDVISENSKSPDIFDYRLKGLVDAWKNREVVIFDTETTGLDFDKAKIIQIAAVRVRDGNVIEEFDEYINVDFDSDNGSLLKQYEESAKIHNITRDTLKSGKSESEVLSLFFDFIGDAPLVAHNMNFDNTMLRMGVMSVDNYELQQAFSDKTTYLQFDTLLLARKLLPSEQSYKLESLLEKYSLPGENSHNALDDVKATSSLLTFLLNKLTVQLNDLDSLINQHDALIYLFTKQYYRLVNLMRSYYSTGCKVSMADLLSDWLDIATSKDGWYPKVPTTMVDDIKNKLVNWLNKNDLIGHINELLNETELKTQELFTLKESDLIDPDKDKLVVSTIHRSKGLEFDTVIIPQVTNNVYPGWLPDNLTDEEKNRHNEEKIRLLYVGMSRPINKLIMSYHRINRNGYSTELYDLISDCSDGFHYKR